jgi:hypothetical protein
VFILFITKMESPPYNVNAILKPYTNDSEYRQCIRQVFTMSNLGSEDTEIDDISRDENDYDGGSSMLAMDYIYAKTRTNVCFQRLYDVAASKMLSMDRCIGLAVLFAYDYLDLFHMCIVSFHNAPEDFNEMNEHFIRLHTKIM